MISVIIPTYKSPEVLDLCLQSAIEGQVNINQIIVVVDGFYDLNKDVLDKWEQHINILNLTTNVGLCRGTNLGVYNAHYDKILIVNDDNVFPKNWDVNLNEDWEEGCVISPNQIEPNSSIFNQFHIHNLGRDIKTFNLNDFWEHEQKITPKPKDNSGSTLPIFMGKMDYIRLGGWDESYEQGMVADVDFFHKCRLSGLKMERSYKSHFYHFASMSVNGDKRKIAESKGHEYFKYKWGGYMKRDNNNNILKHS